MTTYLNFKKYYKGGYLRKKEHNLPLHEVSTIVHDLPKFEDVKSLLNTSSVKLPVASRVNPPYLKCIHMVEKYVYSRGVNDSLTNNAKMVG